MKVMDKEDLEFEEQVGSLKEQAEQYTKKLKKLYASYQTKKSEREELRKEFQVTSSFIRVCKAFLVVLSNFGLTADISGSLK
jgi:peptidoglycan hydrolase CwlO-like protein